MCEKHSDLLIKQLQEQKQNQRRSIERVMVAFSACENGFYYSASAIFPLFTWSHLTCQIAYT